MEGTSMMGVQPTMPVYAGGDGFGFGGGNALTMLIFAFLILGGGFGGFGNRGNVATTDEVSAGFNFAGVNNSLKDLMLGQANINQNLGNAICQSTYELAGKIDNGNYQTLLAIKELGASLKDDKISSLQQQLTEMQIKQATCGLPKVNPYAWGTYPYTCNPCNTCTNI